VYCDLADHCTGVYLILVLPPTPILYTRFN
jgi:hypothetical protein